MAVAATDPDGEIASRGLVAGVDRLRHVGRATHALAAGRVEGGARRAWTAGRVEGGARRAWTAGRVKDDGGNAEP